MAVTIKTYNEILGDLIRKMIADTPVNDVNTGSVLLTLLEAVASNDFENNAALISVLDLLNIDAIRNNDLDSRAADYGLTRIPAVRSSGFVRIGDSTISKRATSLYPIKPAPIAGSNVIYVTNAANWSATGTLYIGRGTQNFEGPISYTSITDYGTYFGIQLASSLQKDHLISDSVIDGQGTTDRLVVSGTIVKIPANNQNPEVQYELLRDAVIPAGEDHIDNVEVIAINPGSVTNAGINTIVEFNSPPFAGATVTNTTAFTNGRDVETDVSLRNRIKSYSQTLARGTKQSILSAIIGLSDSDDNKQVASAVMEEPVDVGQPAIIYIDDGSGFQPSYEGQSVDVLIDEATGKEEFMQLANFPIPRAQVVNTAEGPYQLSEGMTLSVVVDDTEDVIQFTASQFGNIAAATLPEVVVAINSQSTVFKCRLTENSTRLLFYTAEFDSETIRVAALKNSEDPNLYANSVLKFPTDEFSYINLYKNNVKLKEKQKSATLTTSIFSSWNILSPSSLTISVDGTPVQTQTFDSTDFNGIPFASLTLTNWVSAFNKKFAGVQAEATAAGTMRIVSNKEGDDSSLSVLGGDLVSKWFPDLPTEAVGQTSQFKLNRQTGNLQILEDIVAGDEITAGSEDTKGSIVSIPTGSGLYNFQTDGFSRPSEMIIVADASRVYPRGLTIAIGSTITLSNPTGNVMRIMSNAAGSFRDVQPLDYIYITNRGDVSGTGTDAWIDIASCGIYQVINKGEHTNPNVDTYIEVNNPNMVIGGPYAVQSTEDIQAFASDAYPQLWKQTFLATPAITTLQQLVDSINDNIVNVKATIFKSNSVKITSTTENGGSIAIPVSVGNAKNVFVGYTEQQEGNQSHIANKSQSRDLFSFVKRADPTKENVYLGRYVAADIKGALTSNATPGVEGTDPYSEELQANGVLTDANLQPDNIISFTKGANKGHYRSIKDILPGDEVGTQYCEPTTVMDHTVGDELQVVEALKISSEDSVVVIMDNDSVAKTVDIPFYRTGKINSGSQSGTLLPTSTSFSADDIDGEPGIDFGSPQVWGTTVNKTDFKDYAVWMRARNWYASGGVSSGLGQMLIRSFQYGPSGEKLRFNIEYPILPDKDSITTHVNSATNTLFTYVFGSGPARTVGFTSGDTFQVTSLGSHNYRLDFSANIGLNLNPVQIGDVFSALDDSGVTSANRGQFRINAVNAAAKTIDIYNPNASLTSPGNPEVVDITTIADIVGQQSQHTVTTVADVGGNLSGEYFILTDSLGTVAYWYDVDNSGTLEPTHGANRSVKISTVLTGDSAATVAAKTATYLNLDAEFTATVLSNVITVTNVIPGLLPAGNAGTSGFTVIQTQTGSASTSINGKWFKMYDINGSVAVWYDVDNSGTLEPIHNCDRSILINTVVSGDSAATVAAKTASVINADPEFLASALGNVVTVTDINNGNRLNASAGTSGFTVTVNTQGTDAIPETILVATSVNIYPLVGKSVQDIVTKVNETDIIKLVAVGNPALEIPKATREETYIPAGINDYSNSLSYGHNPDPMSGLNGYASLHDSENWVREFDNANPNFVLKKPYVLVGASTVYIMETAPNPDTADIGEIFKLLPRTVENVRHQLTQKALSQLPIVAEVDVSNDDRRVQIKSKLLGSNGAIEVVGGRANTAQYYIEGDSQLITETSGEYVQIKIPAFPDAINTGDIVVLKNDYGVKRKSRLVSSDTIEVADIAGDSIEYRYNPKNTNFSAYTEFSITDVSASYAKSAGTVWRWAFNDSGSQINAFATSPGVVSILPNSEIAAGASAAPTLQKTIISAGTASTPLNFKLEVSGLPGQADYYTFRDALGNTFAVWFDIDGNGTAPTGASYISATYKIQVNILSTDTPNQITSKLAVTLLGNANFITYFTLNQSIGANVDEVLEGDILVAYGTMTNWDSTNKATEGGEGFISGYCVVGVNANSKYIDIVNPLGKPMSATAIGNGAVNIFPTHSIKWHLHHAARVNINQITVVGGIASVLTAKAHQLNVGDIFNVKNSDVTPTSPGLGLGTVVSVTGYNTFTYATSAADGLYFGGTVANDSREETRYKIEKLGFNNLYRLKAVNGESPKFLDCGVALDDYLVLSGTTFNNNNNGRFRVYSVDNDSIIFENVNGREELHTIVPFNNEEMQVTWTTSSIVVSGAAGAFENVRVGDWVKKMEDDDTHYRQVVAMTPSTPSLTTELTLGSVYRGTSGTSYGVRFDQNSDVEQGVFLQSIDDVAVYEGDSAQVGDDLFIENLVNSTWFNVSNTGTFDVIAVGTDSVTHKPFLRVNNINGMAQSAVDMAVATDGMFITESIDSKFYSIRKVMHVAIDEFDEEKRVVYLQHADRTHKFSESNRTSVSSLGKMSYSTDVTIGIDGYLYYTGLMRATQRTVDGFEPDSDSYPGRRAVGGLIEILPPLINRISISMDVTTDDGVNLGEITNEIKSAVINYVMNLGVGEDVILSEIIAKVMGIKGVAAVTFLTPTPDTERIAVASDEKAFIQSEDISIS